jgi:hypothetical protein
MIEPVDPGDDVTAELVKELASKQRGTKSSCLRQALLQHRR